MEQSLGLLLRVSRNKVFGIKQCLTDRSVILEPQEHGMVGLEEILEVILVLFRTQTSCVKSLWAGILRD